MASQELITIPLAILAEWKSTGFSVYSLIEVCGGEDKFYDDLLSGRIPREWADKARGALSADQFTHALLRRIDQKLGQIIEIWSRPE